MVTPTAKKGARHDRRRSKKIEKKRKPDDFIRRRYRKSFAFLQSQKYCLASGWRQAAVHRTGTGFVKDRFLLRMQGGQ